MSKKSIFKKTAFITIASLGLFNFTGCGKKIEVSKPLPVIKKDKIQLMKEDFDLYVLDTFKDIDSFKKRVDKKILNLTEKPKKVDEFIYYK